MPERRNFIDNSRHDLTILPLLNYRPSTFSPPAIVLLTEDTIERVYPYDYPANTQGLRDLLTSYNDTWTSTPILAWLLLPGIYTWPIGSSDLFVLLQRDRKRLLLFVPLLLILAAACLSPVGGYLRYVFGIVMVAKLVAAACAKPVTSD